MKRLLAHAAWLACVTGTLDAAAIDATVRPGDHESHASLPAQLRAEPALRQVPQINPGEYFVPPAVGDIPHSKYGEMVEMGRRIFSDTQTHARRYVGNGLNCANCHLNEGRKPYAAPLWAAYPMYPAFRNKNREVVTFEERIQDCFRYSMDGTAPTLDAPEMKALVVYAHWLSKGAPTHTELPGRGFARLSKPREPSSINGQKIYREQCLLCHGEDMLGKKYPRRAGYMFPPLRGGDSYNRGAGMATVKGCAQFVKANMPLGRGWTLTDMESWDVCTYVWIQDRPWDPRHGGLRNLFMPPAGGN